MSLVDLDKLWLNAHRQGATPADRTAYMVRLRDQPSHKVALHYQRLVFRVLLYTLQEKLREYR